MTVERSHGGLLFTPIGGIAVRMVNKSAAATVAGKLAESSLTTDFAVTVADASSAEAVGVFYNSGIADGSLCWVVFYGIADVLLKDNTASTHGFWVKVSDEAGYADATTQDPPGAGIPEIDEHFTEIGHGLQSVAAGGEGTHATARIWLHLN